MTRLLHNILFALILLTTLDGKPVWVEATQITILRHSIDCAHGSATALRVGGNALCVKETIDQVREKIKQSDEDEINRFRLFR